MQIDPNMAETMALEELAKPAVKVIVDNLEACFDTYHIPDLPESLDQATEEELTDALNTCAFEALKTFDGLYLPPQSGVDSMLSEAFKMWENVKQSVLYIRELEDSGYAYTMTATPDLSLRCITLIFAVHLKVQIVRKENMDDIVEGKFEPYSYFTALSYVLSKRLLKDAQFVKTSKDKLRKDYEL